jgi:hypothetical protein
VADAKTLTLISRGIETEARHLAYRAAIESAPGGRKNPEVVAGSIVVEIPRRWKKPRSCKIRTAAGDFSVKAIPQPDSTLRLESKDIASVAAALNLT